MYAVIVGNIGIVYRGGNYAEARSVFLDYRLQSAGSIGRASGEPVTLTDDGEPIDEYPGSPAQEEHSNE